ncbi:MAG: uracil-DNA glycosylase [Acidimicrobiales bacterium]
MPSEPPTSADGPRRPDPPRPSPGDNLRVVAAEVSSCVRCPRLVAWREEVAVTKRAAFVGETYWSRGVPAFGDPAADLLVVGLAPAAHGANRTGRMFTGDRSGEWLFRALHRAGFASRPRSEHRDDGLVLHRTLVTSPVKCAPPANRPTVEERRRCQPFLEREVALTDPVVVVALGAFGFASCCDVLGLRPRPRFGHGVEVVDGSGRTLLASYHVSQHNTFTGRLTEGMLDDVFVRARELLESGR